MRTPTRTEEILLHRAEQDLEDGIAFKVERIRASGHPFLARAMEAAVTGAVAAIQLRARFREDVLFLCDLARRVNEGADPERLAEENVAQALRLKDLALFARVKDPAFQPVLDVSRRIMAARLPDLARMVAVEDAKDYEDLVRRAFPDPAHVDAFIDENRVLVLGLLDHVARNPNLLRVPASWVPKLEEIGREMVEWQTARVKTGLAEIYAARVG